MWKKFFIGIILIILAIWLVTLNAGPKAKTIQYGVTFSVPYAQGLGIDWKAAYAAAITDLNVKLIRVPVYWDEVENTRDQYDFSDIDYMLNLARQNHVKVILAVGKRLPRWPECHEPGWASKLSTDEEQNAQLSYMETVVQKYESNSAVTTWQVENEPFLSSFGPCPPLDVNFFDKEIALVKSLDPSRPVLITDSGELNWWVLAGNRGDEFGTTYYRYVYSDVLHRYWTNFYFFSWFYRFKAGMLKLLHPGKPVMVAELEAEPWTTAGIPNTPIDQQFKTMSMYNFNTIVSHAAGTGFSPQYLWGVEWWYWMKQHGHPEFWERAKQLMINSN
jgi:hypothetical protein